MNTPFNLLKCSCLAFVIFWMIIGAEAMESDMIPYIMLSFIPVALCTTVVVIATTCMVFWLASNDNFEPKKVFKTYFPYYAICAFSISAYTIIACDFDRFIVAFFTSAFITTCQSWVWFGKENSKRNSAKEIVSESHNTIDL